MNGARKGGGASALAPGSSAPKNTMTTMKLSSNSVQPIKGALGMKPTNKVGNRIKGAVK
jgi:hypothetical protein